MLGEDGQRTPIDLATAQQIAGPTADQAPAKVELPEPVTAHGLINTDLLHEGELPPGVSALDEALDQLQQSVSNDSPNTPIPEGGEL
jgi:hypothetical protein